MARDVHVAFERSYKGQNSEKYNIEYRKILLVTKRLSSSGNQRVKLNLKICLSPDRQNSSPVANFVDEAALKLEVEAKIDKNGENDR